MPDADTAQRPNLEGFECSKAAPISGRTAGKRIGEGMSAEKSSWQWWKTGAVARSAALRQVEESKTILLIGVPDRSDGRVIGAKTILR